MQLEREFMVYWHKLGRRHVELAKSWLPSVLGYGVASGLALVYFTDWKVVATKIPWYNGKFKSNY